ncbi:hypothetical protein BGZ83_012085 [Gryganskiella cystojenkinii]|nr:hypothetical protein BGZ83_012085 [Gryganskiella cystojenkinii]
MNAPAGGKTPSKRASRVRGPNRGQAKTKIIVRRLPANLPEAVFMESIKPFLSEQSVERPLTWVAGKVSKNPVKGNTFARAYIYFRSVKLATDFQKAYHGHAFVDRNGNEGRAYVEFAPFQKVPREQRKADTKQGTIEDDPDYQAFLQSLTAEPTEAEKEMKLSGTEQLLKESALNPKSTPLLEDLRAQKAAAQAKSQANRLAARQARQGGKAGLSSSSKAQITILANRNAKDTNSISNRAPSHNSPGSSNQQQQSAKGQQGQGGQKSQQQQQQPGSQNTGKKSQGQAQSNANTADAASSQTPGKPKRERKRRERGSKKAEAEAAAAATAAANAAPVPQMTLLKPAHSVASASASPSPKPPTTSNAPIPTPGLIQIQPRLPNSSNNNSSNQGRGQQKQNQQQNPQQQNPQQQNSQQQQQQQQQQQSTSIAAGDGAKQESGRSGRSRKPRGEKAKQEPKTTGTISSSNQPIGANVAQATSSGKQTENGGGGGSGRQGRTRRGRGGGGGGGGDNTGSSTAQG